MRRPSPTPYPEPVELPIPLRRLAYRCAYVVLWAITPREPPPVLTYTIEERLEGTGVQPHQIRARYDDPTLPYLRRGISATALDRRAREADGRLTVGNDTSTGFVCAGEG